MRTLLSLVAAVLFAATAHVEVITPSEAIPLFNGKDLTNFYTFIKDRGRDQDVKKVFTVQDGLLRVSGEEYGCITTHEEFDKYRLITEFKWGDETFEPRVKAARDNGILLHSQGEDGGYSGIWMHSIECQIIEGGTGDMLCVGDGTEKFALTCRLKAGPTDGPKIFDPKGEPVTINSGRVDWWGRDPGWKDVIDFRGAQDVEKPVGEWNTVECVVNGGQITIFLNGVHVNESLDTTPKHGRIQVQSEGAEIFFRRIELLPLGDMTAPVKPTPTAP